MTLLHCSVLIFYHFFGSIVHIKFLVKGRLLIQYPWRQLYYFNLLLCK